MTLTELVADSHERARRKGWWDNETFEDEDGTKELVPEAVAEKIPEKLMLIVSEASEALEDYRNGDMATVVQFGDKKPTGFPTELADIIIRVCDLAGALDIDIEAEVRKKAAYNETRPHRHGGKSC